MAEKKHLKKPRSGIGFKAESAALFVGGKHSAMAVGEAVGEGTAMALAKEGANMFGPITAGLPSALAVTTTMSLGGAVSAALTQMEYRHKRRDLKKLYREELAAKCHKPNKAVSEKDLDRLAKGDLTKGIDVNHTISEQLDKTTRQRNWGVFFAVAATLTSLAVVMSIVTVPQAAVGLLGKTLADVAVKGMAGFLSYNVVKQPLHWLGDKLFDLEKETTHDRIVAIKHDHAEGKNITREQILSVFASANPQLDKLIVAQYDKHYDDLPRIDKQAAAEEIAKILPLDQLAADINLGKIKATELAFAVEGQASGVERKPVTVQARKPNIIRAVITRIRDAMEQRRQQAAEQVGAATVIPQEAAAVAVAYSGNNLPGFVDRLGLAPAEGGVTQVERLGKSPVDAGAKQIERLESRALSEAAERSGPH